MFNDLRQAFREAVANFRHELNRDEVPREADELLRRMEGEAERKRVANARLREEIRRALAEAEREEKEHTTCLRRERLAREAGDDETAALAADYAKRHLSRRNVLRRKALALRDELRVRQDELEEMDTRLAEARVRRHDLSAQAGRASARDTLHQADELFEDLDRLADQVAETETQASAAEEMSALAREMEAGLETEAPSAAGDDHDLDTRLEELKRRMQGG